LGFVYHTIPAEMTGDVIYPLNRLPDIAPEVYEFLCGK
jgi:hypothetical protein